MQVLSPCPAPLTLVPLEPAPQPPAQVAEASQALDRLQAIIDGPQGGYAPVVEGEHAQVRRGRGGVPGGEQALIARVPHLSCGARVIC